MPICPKNRKYVNLLNKSNIQDSDIFKLQKTYVKLSVQFNTQRISTINSIFLYHFPDFFAYTNV
jgi:hypothetical protein